MSEIKLITDQRRYLLVLFDNYYKYIKYASGGDAMTKIAIHLFKLLERSLEILEIQEISICVIRKALEDVCNKSGKYFIE